MVWGSSARRQQGCRSRPQSVENSELGYVPACQTTLLHRGARKADRGSENPTADGQYNIKIQEAAVKAQPGDASSSAVWSWEMDDHGRAGRQLVRVVPRGETSETPDPILQRGPPDLVVISHQGGVSEEPQHCPPFVYPRSNIKSTRLVVYGVPGSYGLRCTASWYDLMVCLFAHQCPTNCRV